MVYASFILTDNGFKYVPDCTYCKINMFLTCCGVLAYPLAEYHGRDCFVCSQVWGIRFSHNQYLVYISYSHIFCRLLNSCQENQTLLVFWLKQELVIYTLVRSTHLLPVFVSKGVREHSTTCVWPVSKAVSTLQRHCSGFTTHWPESSHVYCQALYRK